jgi:uncharacterized protein (DUF58 family)
VALGVKSKYRYLDPRTAARLENLSLVAHSVVEGFISGLHKSPYRGFSVEFAEHRKYVPGDDIRDLDWRALGRTDRYYVKQFEEETNLRCHILLDASASMDYKSGAVTKYEYACYLAASLAYLMIRQQDSVGLVTFAEDIKTRIPPRSTATHLDMMLKAVERTEPGGRTNLVETFHALAENIKKRGLIIVLSDLYDDERGVLSALRHFRHKRHEVIVFHIFDHDEVAFPFNRLIEFRDLETGERLQVDPRYAREEYLNQIRSFVDYYKRVTSESNIDYVTADTHTPYDLLLTAYLAARKRAG